jgi:ribose transport system ATP-binding protein
VAVARLLHHDVDVLILDEPTRGIDVASKAEIYRLIDSLVSMGDRDPERVALRGSARERDPERAALPEAGTYVARPFQGRDRRKAVLLVSSYLPELLGVCDRIAVMSRGRLGPARPVEEWTEHSLLMDASGARAAS